MCRRRKGVLPVVSSRLRKREYATDCGDQELAEGSREGNADRRAAGKGCCQRFGSFAATDDVADEKLASGAVRLLVLSKGEESAMRPNCFAAFESKRSTAARRTLRP